MSCRLVVDCDFVDDIRYIELLRACGTDSTRHLLKLWRYLDDHGGLFRVHKNQIENIAIILGIDKNAFKDILECGVENGLFIANDRFIDVGRYVQSATKANSADIRRLNILTRYMPEIYQLFADAGIKSLSKEDFDRIKNADEKVVTALNIIKDITADMQNKSHAFQ